MIETGAYVFGLVMTIIAALNRSKQVMIALFAAMIGYIFAARLSPPEVDMVIYYEYLTFFSPYMLKEFVYYLTTHALYNFLGNQNFVFLTFDFLVLGLVVYYVEKDFGAKKTILFMAVLLFSFIGVMGLQNIYRQFLSSMFLLLAFVTAERKLHFKSLAFILIAIFIHNGAALLAPLPFMIGFSSKFKQKKLLLLFSGMIMAAMLLSYFSYELQYKSNRDTGADLTIAYFLLSVLAFLPFCFREIAHQTVVLKSALFLICLLPVFLLFEGSTAGERTFMFAVPMLLYEIFENIEQLKLRKHLVFLAILAAFCFPALLFYSSRQFIT